MSCSSLIFSHPVSRHGVTRTQKSRSALPRILSCLLTSLLKADVVFIIALLASSPARDFALLISFLPSYFIQLHVFPVLFEHMDLNSESQVYLRVSDSCFRSSMNFVVDRAFSIKSICLSLSLSISQSLYPPSPPHPPPHSVFPCLNHFPP